MYKSISFDFIEKAFQQTRRQNFEYVYLDSMILKNSYTKKWFDFQGMR